MVVLYPDAESVFTVKLMIVVVVLVVSVCVPVAEVENFGLPAKVVTPLV